MTEFVPAPEGGGWRRDEGGFGFDGGGGEGKEEIQRRAAYLSHGFAGPL